MDEKKTHKYCVIEVLDPPYSDFDKYVCVPSSWVSFHEALTENAAVVKFPIENLSDLKKRVRKEEILAEDWPSFMVHIIYSTDSYQHAIEFIKSCKKGKLKRTFETNYRNEAPTTSFSGKKTNSEIYKPVASVSFSCDTRPPVHPPDPEQEQLAESNPAVRDKQIKLSGSVNSANTKKYYTRQASRTSESFKILSPAGSEEPLNQDNVANEAHEKNFIGQTLNCNSSESRELIVNPTVVLKNNRICFKRLVDSLKKVHAEFLEYSTMADEIRDPFRENSSLIEQMIDQVQKFDNLNNSDCPAAKLTSEATKERQNETIEMENMNETVVDRNDEEEQNDNDVSEESIDVNEKNLKGTNKNQKVHARKFTLPKEYDKNDSRWTLKHRKLKKNLVELPPNSGVYVDALKLNNCKRKSKDRKAFARMLLLEIFSTNALSTCSFTGKRANAFDSDGTNIRPGLDQLALNVLLNFVEEYGNDRKWSKVNDQLICNSLRSKLQEMRSKAKHLK